MPFVGPRAAIGICRPQGYSAERLARQIGSHEHGSRPGGSLSAPQSAGDRAHRLAPASRKQSWRRESSLSARLPGADLPEPVAASEKAASAPISGLADATPRCSAEEVLRPSAAITSRLNIRRVDPQIRRPPRGTTDRDHALWAVWVLERWLRTPSTPPQLPPPPSLAPRHYPTDNSGG